MNDVSPSLPRSLGESITQEIRRMLVEGELVPGQRLSEAALADNLQISRNTLREAFRVLTREGLLKHEPNRGVTVAEPDMASIIDIYRVRRFIECKAIAQGYPLHPGTLHMREAVEAGMRAREAKDWIAVGTANMMFHKAIVELADSPRLVVFYGQISAELRLAFGLLNDPEFLHMPYVDMNVSILRCIEERRPEEATQMLEAYLVQSERTVLAAYERCMNR
ncbi:MULTISPECIES: GntR family transcriptional regulator [Pseudomonas]|uniref:Pyruvate dehydrogenase complex transcriptional repressor PdhR n=2 Tax=Pseudomonas TaxID=286 RepID=A0ABM6R5Z1_PSEO1|nr:MULTISPECIES: GntR family transcriptional regulator [Pseudomonas]AUO48884.1 pyruvate dehydrogenase complex transcriptional repressor PdhR [Pseudomonas ogarae]OOG89092.1 GntR family transcriptional regulator [Pseudomonas sp. A25(2017)]OPG71186.1 GntR family transcriptional regulator [Pseudomonas ogarae]OPG76449.1 GntR family transcriptional regulator [Pseudomonas ogarae]QXH94217.1 GntR family transcriptional regulator [Pseudomonas zarinae]